MKSRIGLTIGWICALLVAAFNIFAAITKFMTFETGSPADLFTTQIGIKGMEHPLGVLEFIIVILFLIPRTSTVGFVLMIGYMGGALATNLTHGFGTMDVLPIYVTFLLLTISAYFRNPELTARLRGKTISA